MECNSSNENEFLVNIESEASDDANGSKDPNLGKKWMKKSLIKLVGGRLDLNGKVDAATRMESVNFSWRSVGYADDTMIPLVDNASDGYPAKELQMAGRYGYPAKELQMAGNVKKPSKPPRPPRGPSLDDADIRWVKEISKLATKKRERIERMKALRKTKPAQTPSSASALLSPSSGSTFSAMVVTVIFFLVLIFQALSSTSSSIRFVEAPRPEPETIVSPGRVMQKSAEQVSHSPDLSFSF